jgi:ubiquitin conjugation factor E4 B
VRELGDNVKTVFTPVFKQLYEAVCKLSLHLPDDIADCCGLIDFIAHISSLASVLMKSDYWLPPAQVQLQFVLPVAFRSPISGITYENSSLIGRLLGLTCVLRPSQQSEFFSEPSQQRPAEIAATTESLRQQFNLLTDSLKRIFHNFLRSPDTKADALKWIVHCMRDNKGRKQLIGSMHNLSHFYASDGFFLNLCPVLLKLCEPFTHLSNSSKLASLNPSYCSQQVRQHQYGTTVFIYGMKEETKLNAQLPGGRTTTRAFL